MMVCCQLRTGTKFLTSVLMLVLCTTVGQAQEFKFADLVQPFTPPELTALEKQVQWRDNPVLDSLQLLRERQAQEKLLATPAEALRLTNDSKTNNAKILSALGRLPASEREVDWDRSIIRHSAGDINSMFPLFISSTVEFDLIGLTGFSLFGFDWTFRNFGAHDAVVSWQTSTDGLYDKVVLRDDLTWSDGARITAHDVEYSYQAIMTGAIPVKAVRQGTDQLRWVKAYDDRTVVFFHKEALATNQQNINFPIIPKHVYENTIPLDPTVARHPRHVELNDRPVCGGAYTIESRSIGSEIVLQRRESYYLHGGRQVRDKPYFKTIRFRIRPDVNTALLALKAGDIEEMELTPEQWTNQTSDAKFYSNNTKVYETEWTEFHFLWNCADPRFADKRVRWAMTHAFDHEELLQRKLYGLCEPCTGAFHPTSRWAPKPAPKPIQQDLDKAEELLDEAGWIDSNDDGIRDRIVDGKRVDFDFVILTSNRDDRIQFCNLLKESLDQIGVKCTVRPMEFAALIDKLNQREFQATFGGWGSGTDPDTSENVYATGQNRNYGNYSNKEVDALYQAGKRELDPAKRVKIYQRISQLMWDDQPYTWLYYRNAFYGFNKELRGYTFSPRGPFHFGPGFSSIYKPALQP
jgi:peptide/nickel transport system substrate-binding protein